VEPFVFTFIIIFYSINASSSYMLNQGLKRSEDKFHTKSLRKNRVYED